MSGWIWWIVIPLLVIGWMIWRVRQRGLELKQLTERGVDATGTVVSMPSFRGKSGVPTRQLRYEFQDQLGATHTHTITVSESERTQYVEGGPIAIVYLPDKPQVSAAKSMVDMVRDALERREQSSR